MNKDEELELKIKEAIEQEEVDDLDLSAELKHLLEEENEN